MTKRTGSLESAVEAMNLRIRKGMEPDAAAKDKVEPLKRFVAAYALARQLPKLEGDAHAKTVKAALDELRAAWPLLKKPRAGFRPYLAWVEVYLALDETDAAPANQGTRGTD